MNKIKYEQLFNTMTCVRCYTYSDRCKKFEQLLSLATTAGRHRTQVDCDQQLIMTYICVSCRTATSSGYSEYYIRKGGSHVK